MDWGETLENVSVSGWCRVRPRHGRHIHDLDMSERWGDGEWQAQATNLEFLKYCGRLDHYGLTNRKRNGPSTAPLPLGLRLTDLIVLVLRLCLIQLGL